MNDDTIRSLIARRAEALAAADPAAFDAYSRECAGLKTRYLASVNAALLATVEVAERQYSGVLWSGRAQNAIAQAWQEYERLKAGHKTALYRQIVALLRRYRMARGDRN